MEGSLSHHHGLAGGRGLGIAVFRSNADTEPDSRYLHSQWGCPISDTEIPKTDIRNTHRRI